jgi:flagellar motility protein MotE (MotC chaperone)
MMKILIFAVTMLIAADCFAQKIPAVKTYTEAEVEEIVAKRIQEKMDKVKPGSVTEFSRELLKRDEDLRVMALDLVRREEQLKVSSGELTKKIQEFQSRQGKLLGCMDEFDNQKQKRVDHMVDIVSGMKPQNAAEVLSVQDADIAVRILGQLPAEKVSKIFNLMTKEISARLQKQYLDMKK